jgi:hypothetical protein
MIEGETDTTAAGNLFLDMMRCAMLVDPALMAAYLTGPVNVHPRKFPRGVLDDLVNVAYCAARDVSTVQAIQGESLARIQALESEMRELRLAVDNKTYGVGEP